MELDIFAVLESNPVLVLFLMLGAGLLIGEIRILKVELGAVTGVLLAGLVVGYVGLGVPTASHNIGFLLFIYCIGMNAGPQFVSVFKEDGPRYLVLSLVTAGIGTTLAWWLGSSLELAEGMSAGLLAGALTSTPTLVAAQDAVAQGVEAGGLPAAEVLANISSSYAITYVFGMGGLVLFIAFMPRLFGIDLAAEA